MHHQIIISAFHYHQHIDDVEKYNDVMMTTIMMITVIIMMAMMISMKMIRMVWSSPWSAAVLIMMR